MRILIIFISLFLFASELHIKSRFFNYDSFKRVSIFKKDVNVTKDKDNILCEELKVYFDENKKPLKIIALKNVKFLFILDNNSTYKGYTDKLIYDVKSEDIILEGNSFIKKLETNESLKGEYIKLNRITKDIKVKGNKKPVNIIIKVD